MKVIVIGGVAAGTKAAAKLKRENRGCQVTILTKSADISYAGCGLPYFVGGAIQSRDELIVNTPQSFSALTGVQVQVNTEVTSVDFGAKTVHTRDLLTGSEEDVPYDKLVIATGASPIVPPVPGADLDSVFTVRTPEDAVQIRAAVQSGELKRAVIVGGGFIGLEMAENLHCAGVRATVVEMAPHILTMYDPEMSGYLEDYLADQGIQCFTGDGLTEIIGEGRVQKVKTQKRTMKADAVIMAVGIRPNTQFLAGTQLDFMPNGTIRTDAQMRTNIQDVYAVGDCASVQNVLTHQDAWSPMGSSANLEGRLAAQNLAGAQKEYPGVLGTAVIKLPGINAGRTGLTQTQAQALGYDAVSVLCVVDDKAHYYPGSGSFIVKLTAQRETQKLLGIQVLGSGAVDKMVDIAVTAISLGAALPQLSNLDLAYAPPFSTAIHPFTTAVQVLQNKLSGALESMSPAQFQCGDAEGYTIVDVSKAPSIEGAFYMDFTKIQGPVQGLEPKDKLLLVCTRGKRAYLAQNRLKYYGYTNTRVLEGGTTFNTVEVQE